MGLLFAWVIYLAHSLFPPLLVFFQTSEESSFDSCCVRKIISNSSGFSSQHNQGKDRDVSCKTLVDDLCFFPSITPLEITLSSPRVSISLLTVKHSFLTLSPPLLSLSPFSSSCHFLSLSYLCSIYLWCSLLGPGDLSDE